MSDYEILTIIVTHLIAFGMLIVAIVTHLDLIIISRPYQTTAYFSQLRSTVFR